MQTCKKTPLRIYTVICRHCSSLKVTNEGRACTIFFRNFAMHDSIQFIAFRVAWLFLHRLTISYSDVYQYKLTSQSTEVGGHETT